jgi:hypothetical protein
MDTGMIDSTKLMDIVFKKQLEVARHNDYAMEGLDTEQKKLVLEHLKKYFVKIEDYEVCNEIQIQIDKIC